MFRKLTLADMSAVLSIEQACYPMPWSELTFNACFVQGCIGWVVTIEEKIVGYIIVSIQAQECHIMNICIAPAYWHQGLGTKLLSYTLTEVKQQGAGVVYLEVRCSNVHAITLYEKRGFKCVGTRRGYYPSTLGREDALVFVKKL